MAAEAGMSAKERQKLRSKGIFTVTQLSYTFRPRRAYIRQREVGRDTPSFEQALIEAGVDEDARALIVARPLDVISVPGGGRVVSLEGLALRLLQ